MEPRYFSSVPSEPSSPWAPETLAHAKRAYSGDEQILVVDDDPLVLRSASRMLTNRGYRVSTAMSANEALDVLQEKPGIALVLTDVLMPEMSGRALADRAKKRLPHLKILFMSGYDMDIVSVQGVIPEGLNFIQKPFEEASLCERVRSALDETRL
jgi:CheY-like chemotaxis protein